VCADHRRAARLTDGAHAPDASVAGVGLFKRRSKELFTVPDPGRATQLVGSGFRMSVADVFVIAGRGTVVTGTVEAGAVAVGARVTVERAGRPPLAVDVAAIEMVQRKAPQAGTGDRVGLLFRDVARGEIAAGDVVRTP
jgi:translation elongation factor EF-Tu-like GTPase